MGTKVTVDTVTNLQLPSALSKINENFGRVADEFDNVVYRNGSVPMGANLDLNGNRIINASAGVGNNDLATVGQVTSIATSIGKGSKGDQGIQGATGATGAPGFISKDTYAHLAAITTTNGQTGYVLGPDAGTHTDPVVGGTVSNVGTYSYSTSPAGWQRIGALPATGVGDNMQIFDMRSFVWNGVSYSFRSDGVQVAEATIQALRDLLINCTANKVEIVFPAGVINFGSRAGLTSAIHIQRSNVTIRGQGKNATTIQFGSAYLTLPTVFSSSKAVFDGFGIVGASYNSSGNWDLLNNVTLQDFELEDTATSSSASPDYVTQNASDGIFFYNCNNILLNSIRTVNCKGNGHITINGGTDTNGPTNFGVTSLNVDLINDSTRAGLFGEGDGYNIGSYRNVKIVGGTIIKMRRHGLEGGTPGQSMLLDGLYVDQQGQGFSGLNPTGYDNVRIVNCHIKNVANPFYQVDFTDDPGAVDADMHNLIISNNIFERGSTSYTGVISGTTLTVSNHSGDPIVIGQTIYGTATGTVITGFGTGSGRNGTYTINNSQTVSSRVMYPDYCVSTIRTQTIGAPSIVGRLLITNNIFAGTFYIGCLIGANDAPTGVVANNDCSQMIGAQSFMARISNTGAAPSANNVLMFTDNIFPPNVPAILYTNVPEWRNTRFVRITNNARGRTTTDATYGGGNQYGSLVLQDGGWVGGSVPANSISAEVTVTIADATPGDKVVIYPDPSWPIGPATELCGYVSANNTVKVYVKNNTASSSVSISGGNYALIELVRA